VNRTRWTHERGTLWTLVPGADGAPAPGAIVPVAWEEPGPASVADLAAAMGLADPGPAVGRMERGARGFAGRVDGMIACYGWVSPGTESIGELEREIRLPPAEAYIWDCFTLPGHRGRGLYKALLAHMVEVLRTEGYGRVWIGASLANRPSVRGFEAAGFAPVLRVFYVRAGTRSCLATRRLGRPDPEVFARGRRALARGDERSWGPLSFGRIRPAALPSSTAGGAGEEGALG
jgi:ribosomal protein S18 acetylase RimI-like enzyme